MCVLALNLSFWLAFQIVTTEATSQNDIGTGAIEEEEGVGQIIAEVGQIIVDAGQVNAISQKMATVVKMVSTILRLIQQVREGEGVEPVRETTGS